MVRRLRPWIIVALAGGALALAGSWACRPKPIPVETVAATAGRVEDLVVNSEGGTVKSRASARLGAERAGRVASVDHREGEFVRRGEVVVRLDTSTAVRRLEAARRDLEAVDAAHQAAHAAENLARQDLSRAEVLRSRDLLSVEEMDQVQSRFASSAAELKAAEARREGARAAVRLAEDDLAHHEVRAPFDGVVARRFVENGESVVPGQPLLELMDLDRLYVSAPIDERDASRLARGLPVRVTLDALPGAQWSGKVTRLSPVVETAKEQNRTLEVEVDLERRADGPLLRPGMTADIEIVLESRAGVLRVPTPAVSEGARVLVAERGRAVSRKIEVGLSNWQWTEVRGGLSSGENVITSLDRPGLKSGARIRAKPAAPAALSAPTAAGGASDP